jgi:hypothetical protein
MTSRLAALVVLGTLCSAGMAAAQENDAPRPGLVEVTYMPVGAGFVPSKGNSPSFGNYGFGTSVTLNLNHYLGGSRASCRRCSPRRPTSSSAT